MTEINKKSVLSNQRFFQILGKRNLELKQTGVTVYIGEVSKCLAKIPTESIDCVITSPPYWKQRDYKHLDQIGQENSYFEYIQKLIKVFDQMKRVLKPTGTFFLNVGYKWQNKEQLLIPELLAIELQKIGWALLNKIIWRKPNAMPSSINNRFSNVYEPVFLFVKKESKYRYYLNLDELRKPANSSWWTNKHPSELIGLKVKNALFRDKKGKIEGQVERVLKLPEGPFLAEVKWENGEKSSIIVNDFTKESQLEVFLSCEKCNFTICKEIDIEKHTRNCPGFLRPQLPPMLDFQKAQEFYPSFLFPSIHKNLNFSYRGKYKLSPENRGASPGARKSLFGEYLVLERRYKIFQSIIADYLRFWRKKKSIAIKEIDKLLGYKDTAGHWFRKDTGSWGRGGSTPLPDDWFRLKKILGFDDIYDRWVTEYHLVLQTVKPHPKGKNPGDVWDVNTQPFPEAHFSVFPEELVRKCILAGCPERGVVLDPFAGSGTTGKVAQELGREVILIDLIPQYLEIIKKRCKNIKKIIYVK